jgi:hypothetical protein
MSDVLQVQITRLFGSFPLKDGKQYDALTVASYSDRLALIPPDYLPVVIDRVLDTHVYPTLPTIGEVKAAYMDLALDDTVLSAGEALRWAERQVGRIGGYTPDGKFIEPPYPDPVVRETMRRFGWQRLHRSEADNDWLDKEFARTYAEAREYVGKQVMAGHLTPPPVALPDRAVPALKVVTG